LGIDTSFLPAIYIIGPAMEQTKSDLRFGFEIELLLTWRRDKSTRPKSLEKVTELIGKKFKPGVCVYRDGDDVEQYA